MPRTRVRYPPDIKAAIIADLAYLNTTELSKKYGYTVLQMANFRANLRIKVEGLPKKRIYVSPPPKTRGFEWRNAPTKKFDETPATPSSAEPELPLGSFIRPPSKARLMSGK